MAKNEKNKLEKLVSLSKSRGIIFPGSEIYGGLANTWANYESSSLNEIE